MPAWTVHVGDCRDLLAGLADESIDAVVCDPPYGLSILGADWDHEPIVFASETWRALGRVLKPGAHVVAFGAPRTVHRLTCAIEDAGFEIRDQLQWLYGSGMPKAQLRGRHAGLAGGLKPGCEPIVLARKSLTGTLSQNIDAYGVGQRFPANVLLDEVAAALLDQQTGTLKSGSRKAGTYRGMGYAGAPARAYPAVIGDSGGGSRFFYVAKPGPRERNAGLAAGQTNQHKTVKPVELMRWLCRR